VWLKKGDLEIGLINVQTNGEEINKDLRDKDEITVKEYTVYVYIYPKDKDSKYVSSKSQHKYQ
jgi:hypothetical protein